MKIEQVINVECKIFDTWVPCTWNQLEYGDLFRIKDSFGMPVLHNGRDELIFVSQTIIVDYPKSERTLWHRIKSFFTPKTILL
jgi:uncharacterized protein YxjI